MNPTNDFIIEDCGDYFDFPRLFVIKESNSDLLFSCGIAEDNDEYLGNFIIYKMDSGWDAIQPIPWMELPTSNFANELMRVRVSDVMFSGHKNRYLSFRNIDILEQLSALLAKN